MWESEIYGRVALQSLSEKEKNDVCSWLKKQIAEAGGEKKFGAVISSGKLFAGLEMLPGVVRVQELNLERVGSAAEKMMTEEISICRKTLLLIWKK